MTVHQKTHYRCRKGHLSLPMDRVDRVVENFAARWEQRWQELNGGWSGWRRWWFGLTPITRAELIKFSLYIELHPAGRGHRTNDFHPRCVMIEGRLEVDVRNLYWDRPKDEWARREPDSSSWPRFDPKYPEVVFTESRERWTHRTIEKALLAKMASIREAEKRAGVPTGLWTQTEEQRRAIARELHAELCLVSPGQT